MLTFIDVAWRQIGIDLSGAGVDGVIIKASGANDGLYVAGGYAGHVTGARPTFGNVGHYFFNGLDATPTEAADWFVDHLLYVPGDALILDIEAEGSMRAWTPDEAFAFVSRVRARMGVTPMLYMSAYPAQTLDWSECIKAGAKLWVAAYGKNGGKPGTEPEVGAWGEWSVWQYTSQGIVPGWDEGVDLSLSRLKMQEVHPVALKNYVLREPARVISDDDNNAYVSWAHHLARTGGARGGVDIIAAVGTPIYARTAGRMIQIPDDGSAGNSCRFYHRDNVGWKDVFSHLSSYRTPKNPNGLNAFDYEAGDIVAYTGDTGGVVQHLHWHLLDPDGVRRNPWDYFDRSGLAGGGFEPIEEDDMFGDGDRTLLIETRNLLREQQIRNADPRHGVPGAIAAAVLGATVSEETGTLAQTTRDSRQAARRTEVKVEALSAAVAALSTGAGIDATVLKGIVDDAVNAAVDREVEEVKAAIDGVDDAVVAALSPILESGASAESIVAAIRAQWAK